MYFYSRGHSNQAIQQSLATFWSNRSKFTNTIFTFLGEMVEFLGRVPRLCFIYIFQDNIHHFYRRHPSFFRYSNILSNIGRVSWENRYSLLCYALSLEVESTEAIRMTLLRLIASKIRMHTWASKEMILMFYFGIMLEMPGISMTNPRKRSYILRQFLINTIVPSNRRLHARLVKSIVRQAGLDRKHLHLFRRKLKDKLSIMVWGLFRWCKMILLPLSNNWYS